ncbi:MAG: hypothetical protein M4D80_19770 [Myxococcota bacterium]|nr:hypothetical protein [Myxococcota bacterium]
MRFVLVLALVAACSTKPNPKSCLDNHCSDPALPFCDVDGSIGGDPNTCIAVECTPNAFEKCEAGKSLVCNAGGDNFELTDCEFGCSVEAGGCMACDTPSCNPTKYIIPKYLPDACAQPAAQPALAISSNTALDTSNNAACSSIVTQAGAPDICVLRYGTITIEAPQTYSVKGSRVLALVSDGALTVDGILEVSGNASVNGPGGGFVKSGTGQTAAGGGAGYRHPGGAGATTSVSGGANNGGPAGTNPLQLTQLFGGPQPTKGTDGSSPGGGGGGVTLISCRDRVSVAGTVDAGGGGGFGDAFVQVNYRYAAGGGAGGTIVLQGMNITVTGGIFANGGGGGGGGGPGGLAEDGRRAMTNAVGGAPNTLSGGGYGGYGGTAIAPIFGEASSAGAGAGGGSAGFILTYTPQAVLPAIGDTVSPPYEPNGTVATN